MNKDNHSVTSRQWAKLGLSASLVLLLVIAVVVSAAYIHPSSSSVGNISMLEQKAQSNQYSYSIYTNDSSIYATNYSIGNSTKLLTRNPMDAAAVINSILSQLNPLSGISGQVQMVQIKGSYIINASILVPSWCILDLRLATFTLANATDKDMITNSHQVLGNEMIGVIGGTLDGNKLGQTGGPRAPPASALIHFWNSHEILTEDIQLRNAKWENLLFSICYDVLARNIDSQGAGYQGIATEFGSHNVLITNCRTYDNEADGILVAWNNITVLFNTTVHLPDGYNTVVSNCEAYNNAAYGISIEGYSSTHNITLTNSSIYGNVLAGIHVGTGSELLITNSDIFDNGFACRVTIGEQNPAATSPVNGLTISDCTIHDNTNGGIYLIGISSSAMIQNVFITHNQFSNNTSHGGTDYYKVNATWQITP